MNDRQYLCMGCFSYNQGKVPCPSCGFDHGTHYRSPLVLPAGTRLFGERYMLGRTFGKPGAFDVKYIAWDTFTDTKVVIKEYFPAICASRQYGETVPFPHSSEDEIFFRYGLDHFRKEALRLMDTEHPNIARVRDYFDANNTGYLVMNYYEGQPLTRYLTSMGGKLDWKTSCLIISQILDGLRVIHAKKGLHHDIRPCNIIYINEEKRPVLINFSAARSAFYKNLLGSSGIMISRYSPIESYVSNIKEGPWTDIYCCGAAFYKMVSGQDPPTVPERILSDQLICSNRHIREMPDDIASAVLKAMALDVSVRFHGAAEFQNILMPYLDRSPVTEEQKNGLAITDDDILEYDPELDGQEGLMDDVADAGTNEMIRKIIIGSLVAFIVVSLIGYLILWEKDYLSGGVTEEKNPEQMNSSEINHLHKGFEGPHGMRFVYIPPGEFMMGSPEDEKGRDDDETQHTRKISKGYYIQTTEVTQAQWSAVMGMNPSSFRSCGPSCPVESISWENVRTFIFRLNSNSKDFLYRLPTEAEWERACRAGSRTSVYKGDAVLIGEKNATIMDDIAWYGGNSCVGYPAAYDCSGWGEKEKQCDECGPHPVALKEPNSWGLYDMIGNVGEWCSDWYYRYDDHASQVSQGAEEGGYKIFRGGAWYFDARFCRAAARSKASMTSRFFFIGFRLAADRKIPQESK